MERHEVYKDSRVEWLGEIPAEWEVKKLKYEVLVNPLKDNFDQTSDELVTFLPMDSISENGEADCSIKKPVSSVSNGFTFFRKNDVIVAKITPCFENGKCVLLSDLDTSIGFGSTEFHVLRPKRRIFGKFLYYITKSEIFMQSGEAFMYGAAGQKRVPSGFISDFPLVLPNVDEQTAIANFLDRKTAEIDALIAQKECLLELYEEEKTAIINHAVTKGIDPNAELKDSGIDWLGEIPVGWKVKKLKYLLKKNKGAIKTGPFGSQLKNSELTPSGVFKVYTQRNVLDEDFIKGDDRIDYEKFNTLKEFEIKPNDILFTTRGTIGRCAIFPSDTERGVLHPCLIRIQMAEELVLLEWIIRYVNNSSFFIENVTLESNSTIIDVIYGGTLKEVVIPIPPREEQACIISFLDYSMTALDAKITKTQCIIELQKEYRTALISEAVTGKIKVPELPTQEASA